MKIIWSDQTKVSYERIIDDILDKWSPNIAIDFEYKTNKLLDVLKKHNHLCPNSNKQNLRKCVIHKNVSLIYKINNSVIELVTFIDNRANHNY